MTFHRRHKVRLDPPKCSNLFTFSLDDDLPDISDLLKRYPRPSTNADIAALKSSAPITLPRPSLRSSTFDGKTIFLKRKSRMIGASVCVPVHRIHTKSEPTLLYTRDQSGLRRPWETS